MWIPAYMKEYFWAGMKTTQRVKSINSFFDGFVNRHTKLFEFPQKYSKAMEKRVRDETDANANCSKYLRRLVTGFKIEKIFQKLYTDIKFQEVQKECSRMMYCYCWGEEKLAENLVQYVVEDRVWIVPEGTSEEVITNRRRYFCATFNKVTSEVSCDCRKFETHGIMCKHMMRILDQNLVFNIPEKYIMSRWCKDILRKHTCVKVSYHDPSKTMEVRRYNNIMSQFEALCDEATMVNDETVDMVLQSLSKLRSTVVECRERKMKNTVAESFPGLEKTCGGQNSGKAGTTSTVQQPVQEAELPTTMNQPTVDEQINDDPPLVVKDPLLKKRPRGRPKGSRNKSLAEVGYKKNLTKKATADMSKDYFSCQKIHVKRQGMIQVDFDESSKTDFDFEEIAEDELLSGHDLQWNSGVSDTF